MVLSLVTRRNTFFFQNRRSWGIHQILDPCDPDPIRYALLACVVEVLVDSFNWRLSIGMRRDRNHVHRDSSNPHPPYDQEVAPPWTKHVPPIDKRMRMLRATSSSKEISSPQATDFTESDYYIVLSNGTRSPLREHLAFSHATDDHVSFFVTKDTVPRIFSEAENKNIVIWVGDNLKILAPLEWCLETKLRRLSTHPDHPKAETNFQDVLSSCEV
ncbi:hypothetical protein AJ80_09298 [Polytolypa hystricis UAMH7299]|uniref:Uncharacterized protein n=1 Tax=Polytolypa hystricis (strain UAMH7299) TaxID=1447883 RepID=A0A2B7WSW5_POLH7|nr:hypothetical protein AJ80_09298 [Polytolypa hystricis UAMH7299]